MPGRGLGRAHHPARRQGAWASPRHQQRINVLPWFLTPLRPSGFLGRALAQQLAPQGFASKHELWPLEQALFAATLLPDSPGAIQLGSTAANAAALPELATDADLDRLADATTTATAPAGSSAGGEQAKFLAREPGGRIAPGAHPPPQLPALAAL